MANCNLCKHDKENEEYGACYNCENGSEFVRITNADRIRSMTDEELAEFLCGTDHYWDDGQCIVRIGNESMNDSTEDILEWLQSEVGEKA